MSIIASQTHFYLSNKTSHFLEITIIAEQDEDFRMTQTNSNQIIPISNDNQAANGFFAWAMEGLLNTFTGSKLHEIRINLPANSKAPMDIRCTSTLSFNTNIKSKQCTEVISGDFNLGPEYHGETMTIVWEPLLGYGYDDKGNVAIGGNIPSKRDMAINCQFYDKDNKNVTGIEVTPASCKINFK